MKMFNNLLQSFHLTVLQSLSTELDIRVTALEENGGDDGNSSVAELEVRVETLEGTAADHETRISATEVDIEGTQLSLLSSKVTPERRTNISFATNSKQTTRIIFEIFLHRS